MKKSIAVCTFLGAMLISGIAFAQDDESKMQTISFEDDRVEGELMMPNTGTVSGHEMEELSSLIKAREDFVDEMRKTVDEM